MDTKDIIAFLLIEIATLVMAYAWLQRFVYNPYNWVIIFCLLIVVGVASYMILSLNSRLNEIEEKMESRDKSIRVSIMTVEADLENQMQRLNNNVESAVTEINRKRFI
ncbi:hypothetical protein MmiHf6_09960 [Methanimicrococcus hongohii]|uniref:Uncharacterized protein n=1 Tax=Methanimicrococcus hongohii TaxID=3028295 RepID=A0AA96V0S9_9EURY|nr:hypothetical protein [Methanimicrococcus sp. Hf6]WNY23683.1 hypothetical protein MmiHf6_09960 [Methanimicrococcus sp. Hf6]